MNFLQNFKISHGFLQKENVVDKNWIKKTLDSDEKFLEIKAIAADIQTAIDILNIGISISASAKNIIFVGIGGSTLAGQAFNAFSSQNSRNLIYFIDNLDKLSIIKTMESINLAESFFIFISKSGNTIETITQMCAIIENLISNGFLNEIYEKCIAITANKSSSMGLIAKKYAIQTINWSGDVSGRFSAFSNNSNLINSICGGDILQNLNIFINTIDEFTESDEFVNHINFTISSIKNGIKSNILMCYNQQMSYFIDWYIQLWAESIGKNNIGTNPCKAIGTIDQHSKLQLFLGGPKDKIFTIIGPKNNNESADINWNLFENCDIDYLKNINMDKIVSAAFNGTIQSLRDKNLPVRYIQGNIDSIFLTQMMTFYILETILSCHYFKINPYNQPEVEASKQNLLNNL